jgi:hypothetical protein
MTAKNVDLKRFLDAKKVPSILLGDLERYLQGRPAGDRSTTVLHPSEIIKRDWCHRASYFLLSGQPKKSPNPTLKMQVIFDEGHAIHAKWQAWFQGMGILHGRFKCEVCDDITWGTSPQACEHCGAGVHKLIYDEVTLYDDALRIKGHTDGWVKKANGEDMLIEIKSIGPGTLRGEVPDLMAAAGGDFMKAWQMVKRPFAPHIMQGQMYLELMRRMGHPIDRIIFLYELKADNSFKEFSVKADPELVYHIFEGAERVVRAVEAGIAPACTNNSIEGCAQCNPYKED